MKLVYTPVNLSFLKTLIINLSFSRNIKNDKFVTSGFRKETFSGVNTNAISFIPLEFKFGLVHTLLNCCSNLYSGFLKFHYEVDKLKKILSKNAYPQKFVDKYIQKFVNNIFIQRPQFPTVPKKELIIILPCLGKMSQIVKTRPNKTINKHIKSSKLRVIFQTNNRLRNHFHFKDFVHETLRSSLIYAFSCGSCTLSCIGKTYRHFKVRVSERQGVSNNSLAS